MRATAANGQLKRTTTVTQVPLKLSISASSAGAWLTMAMKDVTKRQPRQSMSGVKKYIYNLTMIIQTIESDQCSFQSSYF
jgi:hypothetical protein